MNTMNTMNPKKYIILVAVDKSSWAYTAFFRALEDVLLKRKLGIETDLYIMHAGNKSKVSKWMKSVVEGFSSDETKSRKILTYYSKIALDKGIYAIPIRVVATDGGTAVTICNTIEEIRADKIFLGSYGHSKKAQLGSTVKAVADKAYCDVTIVRSGIEIPPNLMEDIRHVNVDQFIVKSNYGRDKQFFEYAFAELKGRSMEHEHGLQGQQQPLQSGIQDNQRFDHKDKGHLDQGHGQQPLQSGIQDNQRFDHKDKGHLEQGYGQQPLQSGMQEQRFDQKDKGHLEQGRWDQEHGVGQRQPLQSGIQDNQRFDQKDRHLEQGSGQQPLQSGIQDNQRFDQNVNKGLEQGYGQQPLQSGIQQGDRMEQERLEQRRWDQEHGLGQQQQQQPLQSGIQENQRFDQNVNKGRLEQDKILPRDRKPSQDVAQNV